MAETVGVLIHERQPAAQNFNYYRVNLRPQNPIGSEMGLRIHDALTAVRDEFGIQFRRLEAGQVPLNGSHDNYFLIDPIDPLDLNEQELGYLRELSQTKGAKVNIVPRYDFTEEGDTPRYEVMASTIIPIQDRVNHMNTIFADDVDYMKGRRTVSSQDIFDNIICETIRAKYKGIYDGSNEGLGYLEVLQQRRAEDIEKLAEIFKEHGLWHRAPTDGAVIFAEPEGYLVSQTRTPKNEMTADNFSIVTAYDAQYNAIKYTGKRIPSSDSPDFLVMLDRLKQQGKEYKMAVHFHKNEMTRGQEFIEKLTSRTIEYGRFESGEEIADELIRIGGNWLILREHGMVWLGDSVEEFEEWIKNLQMG